MAGDVNSWSSTQAEQETSGIQGSVAGVKYSSGGDYAAGNALVQAGTAMNASAQVVATATAGEQNASHVMTMAAQTQRIQNRITADRAGAMSGDPSLAGKKQMQEGTKALSAIMADAKAG
jgi:hypothetical protein